MKNLRIHNKVITAGNMNYLQRQQQLQHGIEEHYRELQIPPGNPTQKPYWGQPEQTGEPIPTVAGDYSIPRGWPREPVFNPPGGPPGPPIQFGEPTTNDNVTAGYGYVPNALEERDLYFYHPDHLGSTSIITDKAGVATQFVAYMPFGEPLVDEHVSRKEMPYKFNGKEIDEETGLYYYGARYYDAATAIWYGTDLMQEKYPGVSTYAYCANNPVKLIDPNGMDVYDYDDKTGDFTLYQKTDDNFDQVGKFKYDKKTGEKTLQTNRKGEAKTRIDNVEKGILSDGINFMNNNNVIAVGGEGQASVDGVEAFAVNLSDMVGKEIGGAYFSKDGAESTTHISIGRYKNNSFTETKGGHGHTLWQRMNLDSKLADSLTGFFHTHPSSGNISVSDRTRPSEQDKKSRNNDLKLMPNLQFYILTHPVSYGDKFPNKISYTNAR